MALDEVKEEALLEWINSMKLDQPVFRISDLQDGVLLMRVVHTLKREEPPPTSLELPIKERFRLLSNFLQGDCKYSGSQGTLVSWENLKNGNNLEIELSKVVLLLLFHAAMNGFQNIHMLEYKFELELASMLRFVVESESESSIYLGDCLEKYLKKKSVATMIVKSDCSSVSSFTDDESPVFQRSNRVQFLELNTVATSSVSSPLQDVMKTPQFQRRMQMKELSQEREMRDELERELANCKTTIEQRETQIQQLQHRLERLQREQAELEQGPRVELEELNSKNHRLQSRLHEVLKQHQDLKTNSSHMERKVDQLTEENGTLSVQIGEVCTRLASAEAEVRRLTETQMSAQDKWNTRHSQLQTELGNATAEKDCLNEKIQILQSKILFLEDELSRALTQEKGESMGPIMEWEQLRQELADATLRNSELETTISSLEGQIQQIKTQHAEEKAELQSESQRLLQVVTDLEVTLSALQAESGALHLALKEQRDSLNAQLQSLTRELDSLNSAIQQKEKEAQALREEVQEERRKAGELKLAMEKHERETREEIQGLKDQVETMETSLMGAEDQIQTKEGLLVRLQSESSAQKEELQEEIQNLRIQMDSIKESLKKAEQEIRAKEEQLCRNQLENTKQVEMLQACVAAHKEEVEVLKEAQKEKESLLLQARENMETLQTEMSTISSLSADKDVQLSSLREEVAKRSSSLRITELEVQVKEDLLAKLQEDSIQQKGVLQLEIQCLKVQVESMGDSLRRAEEEIQEKEEQLTRNQEEIVHQKVELQGHVASLEMEVQTIKKEMQAKEEQLEALKMESSSQKSVLQEDMQNLRTQIDCIKESLKKAEEEIQAKEEQLCRNQLENAKQVEMLQACVAATKEEVEVLKVTQKEKESLLLQASEKMEALQAEMSTISSLSADKDLQLSSLREEVAKQSSSLRSTELEVQVKEELLAKLQEEIYQQKEVLQQEIQCLNAKVEGMGLSLRRAEEEIQEKEEHLTSNQEEIVHQKVELQGHVASLEMEVQTIKKEMQAKEEQLEALKMESSSQKSVLQEDMQNLRTRMDCIKESLKKAEEEIQAKEEQLCRNQLENAKQVEMLQACVAATKEEVEVLKVTQKEKESLLLQASEKMEALQAEMSTISSLSADKDLQLSSLREEVAKQSSSLRSTELEVQVKGELLAKLQAEDIQQKEVLQQEIQCLKVQVESTVESLRRAEEEFQAKEEEVKEAKDELLANLQEESARQKENLLMEIQSLKVHMDSMSDSLQKAVEDTKAKEEQLVKQQQESTQQKKALQEQLSASEQEVQRLKLEIQAKEDLLQMLKKDNMTQSGLQDEILNFKAEVGNLGAALRKAEEQLCTKEGQLTKNVQDSAQQVEMVQNLLTTTEEEVKILKQAQSEKESLLFQATEKMEALQAEMSTISSLSAEKDLQLCSLREEVEKQSSSLRITELELQVKEDLLAKSQEENIQQKEVLQQEIQCLKVQVESMGDALRRAEEEIQNKEEQLTRQHQESSQQKEVLEERVSVTDEEVKSLRKEIQVKEQQLVVLKTDNSALLVFQVEIQAKEELLDRLQNEKAQQEVEIQGLKGQVENMSDSLKKAQEEILAREEELVKQNQEGSQNQVVLQQKLAAKEVNLNQFRAEHTALKEEISLKDEALQETQTMAQRDKDVFLHEKEALETRVVQAEEIQKELEKQIKTLHFEKERLAVAKQALEQESGASQTLQEVLQQELVSLRLERDRLFEMQTQAEEKERVIRDLQEQLVAKTEAVEHYKAQVEKAKSHYSGKKQQLQESQEQMQELHRCLEVKEHEVKAFSSEVKLLQMDLDKVRSNEKLLNSKVTSLEAQLAFADRKLREQSRICGVESREVESVQLQAPDSNTQHDTSKDSLDLSMDDSLNTTRKPSVPEESSTPMVRSSERLATKRRAIGGESLETLYFTPMNQRQINRTSTERRLESSITTLGELALDSARKPPTSSARRRRTTQVINITLSKQKTPGRGEGAADGENETFYSLASARSHPNLTHSQAARPISMELFDTPGKAGFGSSDQLLSLPGYRRSTTHIVAPPRSTSTFCVGAENEPEYAGDDWMRIAELQSRNKACLPHLKSSYPLEARPVATPAFTFTDDDLRMGDPTETIRRASMMPGQILDSLPSHRLSLMPGQIGAGYSGSQRQSLAPKASDSQISQSLGLRSSGKRSATDQLQTLSPESKRQASCFPRPLTPKDRNRGGSSSTLKRQPLSPADRRQSMMFTIENTPQKGSKNLLQRGMNKLRSSTRKSPGSTSRKSPAHATRKSPGKVVALERGKVGAARATKKSPQGAGGQRRSPRTRGNSTAKSPNLTSSARKMMSFRMKV